MKYHVTELGEIKRCVAKVRECRFGDFMGEHYATKALAQKAYSNKVETLLADEAENSRALERAKEQVKILEKQFKDSLASNDSELIEKSFEAFRQQTLTYGKAFRESYLLNSKKAAMGLEELREVPKPWSDYPYKFDPKIYYPTRWGKMEFHHGLPDDLKSLLAKELSAFSDYSFQEAYEKVDGFSHYEETELAAGRTPLDRDSYIVSLFQEGARNQKKDRLFVDIETTGFDPRFGEIIEIGIVRISPEGEIKERYEERFDLESAEYRDARGVGPTEIHKISSEDLVGKRKFSDPAVQDTLDKFINDPEVILGAHNDSFEKKYLNLHLKNFWKSHATATKEQRENNNPMQDTMLISTFLEHSTENNRLQSFAEGNGVPYENAHSALADSEMTAIAYANFRKKLMAMPLGKRPTIDQLTSPN